VTLDAGSDYRGFAVRISSFGQVEWIRELRATQSCWPASICSVGYGKVAIAGWMYGTYLGVGEDSISATDGDRHHFIQILDSVGGAVRAEVVSRGIPGRLQVFAIDDNRFGITGSFLDSSDLVRGGSAPVRTAGLQDVYLRVLDSNLLPVAAVVLDGGTTEQVVFAAVPGDPDIRCIVTAGRSFRVVNRDGDLLSVQSSGADRQIVALRFDAQLEEVTWTRLATCDSCLAPSVACDAGREFVSIVGGGRTILHLSNGDMPDLVEPSGRRSYLVSTVAARGPSYLVRSSFGDGVSISNLLSLNRDRLVASGIFGGRASFVTQDGSIAFEPLGTSDVLLASIEKVVARAPGAPEVGMPSAVAVWPNPASATVFVEIDPTIPLPLVVTVHSALGVDWPVHHSVSVGAESTVVKIDVTGFPPGIYWVSIVGRLGNMFGVFLVQR
jgi:hypothetical protein